METNLNSNFYDTEDVKDLDMTESEAMDTTTTSMMDTMDIYNGFPPFETQEDKKVEPKPPKPQKSDFPPLPTSNCKKIFGNSALPSIQPKIDSPIYVVFDTNIWMHNLIRIDELLNDATKFNYRIYIPEIVGNELDRHKRCGVQVTKDRAKNAISARNRYVKFTNRVTQQSREEAEEVKQSYKCRTDDGDHEILCTCLALINQGKEVMLCTNDQNFESNAIANHIPIYPPISAEDLIRIEASKFIQ